jgi:hypothetical protein
MSDTRHLDYLEIATLAVADCGHRYRFADRQVFIRGIAQAGADAALDGKNAAINAMEAFMETHAPRFYWDGTERPA